LESAIAAATFHRSEQVSLAAEPASDIRIDGRREQRAHVMSLMLGPTVAHVRLGGDIDLLAAADVARLMESLDIVDLTIRVDLSDVRFMDSAGLDPLVEATRRRRARSQPPVLMEACSRAALRLLKAAALDAKPSLDVETWDRLGQPERPTGVADR
jgi:anti-anti-sigma factor